MSKRVIRIISYEGNPDWIDNVLARSFLKLGKTFFNKQGTIKELDRIDLGENHKFRYEIPSDLP